MTQYNDPNVRKRIMLEYLQLMISREDWHGVADAAMDLRDMAVEDATMKQYQSIKDKEDDKKFDAKEWNIEAQYDIEDLK